MIGVQQKTHRTVTQELSKTLATVADATAAELARLDKAINDERTHRLKMAHEQRSYVDAEDRKLRACCQERWDAQAVTNKRGFDMHGAFVSRGFWSRLNWLLTGR